MATVHDASPDELIPALAKELKGLKPVTPPYWATYVKTGLHKERPPVDPDWWFVRAAAVLRKVYILGPIGVGKLRSKYGGKQNRGVKPGKTVKGSGSIIRAVLQQLTEAGLVEEGKAGTRKGRIVTKKGQGLVDKTAGQIVKAAPKPEPEPKKPTPKPKAEPKEKSEDKPKDKSKEQPEDKSKAESKGKPKVEPKEKSADKPAEEPKSAEKETPEKEEKE
ncbi:MAG: 30S ribosomal protein S19e [archaeon]